jgi:hypothetical protein
MAAAAASPIERHHRQRYDPAMSDVSDDPRDKLQAALNPASSDPDDDLGAEYRDACAAWFSRLTQGERWRLAMVIAAYERGAEADAEQLAAVMAAGAMLEVAAVVAGYRIGAQRANLRTPWAS